MGEKVESANNTVLFSANTYTYISGAEPLRAALTEANPLASA